jgi:hypothetical protein
MHSLVSRFRNHINFCSQKNLFIDPLEWMSEFVIIPNAGHNMRDNFLFLFPYSAFKDVSGKYLEPSFSLVQPRRIRRVEE